MKCTINEIEVELYQHPSHAWFQVRVRGAEYRVTFSLEEAYFVRDGLSNLIRIAEANLKNGKI